MRFRILAEDVNENEPRYRSKMHSGDRKLILEKLDPDKSIRSSTGLIDNRLVTGEHNLRAVRDPRNSLWRLRYTNGILPKPLKQTFTSFSALMRFTEDYFKKRNVKIAQVVDFDDES